MSTAAPLNPFGELVEAARSVRHLDRRFWAPNIVFLLDGAAYFGILNVLTLHLDGTLGLGEARSGQLVSMMTALLTLAMVFLGPTVDKLGVRRSMTWTIAASLLGRGLLVAAPALGGGLPVVVAGLALMAVGGGVLQTAVYAGVKQATDERTSGMGFSLIYALMNLGIVLESAVSSPLRASFGTTGVLAMCTAITGVYLLVHIFAFPRGAGEPVPKPAVVEGAPVLSWRDHPLLDLRFLYFIFILIGVRTLFAHQWLTMPDYVTRAFPEAVGARYEWISGLNPLIIVVGTPLVAALTRRVSVLTMMIVGTGVSALATFLLVPGPNLAMLLAYVVIFSIGEALWSSRFLEYVSQLAPPERVGVYMGLANVPWFLAKFTTGLYSGAMIAQHLPKEGPMTSGTMWLIYTGIALTSPVGLLLARPWLRRGDAAL